MVDDEPDVVKSVQDLLRLDYKVLGATRAGDALVILNREIVDVVMTDQRMPEMSGVEFLSKSARATSRRDPAAVYRLCRHPRGDRRDQSGQCLSLYHQAVGSGELQTVIREACERRDAGGASEAGGAEDEK